MRGQAGSGTPQGVTHSSVDATMSSVSPASRTDTIGRRNKEDLTLKDSTLASHESVRHTPTKPPTSTFTPPVLSTTTLSRAGTLSWQQRPGSSGSTSSKTRPLSVVAAENSSQTSPEGTAEDKELSRAQIAQSLSSKDPTWFMQTAGRGLGSAAYRKPHSEAASDAGSRGGNTRLPGMSREATVQAERESSIGPESIRSTSPSRDGSNQGSTAWSQNISGAASVSSASIVNSPLPLLTSQRLDPPTNPKSSPWNEARSPIMSPSQGRISPERIDRPHSPTKGLGGFVQSAMLKRSDSVSKRWSAQAAPGLSRGNSVSGNRSLPDNSRHEIPSLNLPKELRASNLSREASPTSTSRPASSHSNMTTTQSKETDNEANDIRAIRLGKDEFVKPSLPKSDSREPLVEKMESSLELADRSVPSSPNKAADSKRWSPSKASWLESAINKPDSPKPKVFSPQQPSWMVNINKAKQTRGSIDLETGTNFTEVSTSGLLRSPPISATVKSSNSSDNSGASTTTASGIPSTMLKKYIQDEKLEMPAILPSKSVDHKPSNVEIDSVEASQKRIITSPGLSTANHSKTKTSTNPQIDKAPIAKPKPLTPPKKDFRSTLKTRQMPAETEKNKEPEFKNVFGKLKRTETKNYVATDELKSNILRGKAGLVVTDGPQKTEQKDELKESILKKKHEMKAGGPPAVARKTSAAIIERPSGPPIPEAIARRQELARSANLPSSAVVGPKRTITPVDVAPKPPNLTQKSEIELSEKVMGTERLQRDASPSDTLADRFIPGLAGVLSRGPSPTSGRFQGMKVMSPTDFQSEVETSSRKNDNQPSSSPQLTHATKARARGPKRRLPTSLQVEDDPTVPRPPEGRSPSMKAPNENLESSPPVKSKSPGFPPKPPLTLFANITNGSTNMSQSQSSFRPDNSAESFISSDIKRPFESAALSPTSPKSNPLTPTISNVSTAKEPLPRKSSTSVINVPAPSPRFLPPATESVKKEDTIAPEAKLQQPTKEENVSVLGAAARWGSAQDQRPQQVKSPIRLPTRKDEESAMKEAGLDERNAGNPIGLGIRTTPKDIEAFKTPSHSLPSPPFLSSRSPPLPTKKPELIKKIAYQTVVAPTTSKAGDSPVPRTSEALRLLTAFFDDAPKPKSKIDIDTQAILASRYAPEKEGKIQNPEKQIWEVTSDGKRFSIPAQQEHILFEESMYLCSHVFGLPNGKRTKEAYLWCGDGVSSSAVEEVQLFCRNIAKEAGGKLIILKQGKESSNFFEALGGIVITRRGSSGHADSASGSSATYMLCGRRHMGQIAFDEVTFSPTSLCSGFPYIVSATSGRLYLWKGKGSSADELGCARLIGMDLGLTGEIEEIDEGHEPDSFWKALRAGNGKTQPIDIGHWHLKANTPKYATRLFTVELETRPKSSSSGYMNMWGRRGSTPAVEESTTAMIREVVPFAQADLNPYGIYVLDAFFEVFV